MTSTLCSAEITFKTDPKNTDYAAEHGASRNFEPWREEKEVEEEDRLDTWVGDAESAEERGRVGTARAILAYALRVFPDRKFLWRKAADLEKIHGTKCVVLTCCLQYLY